MKVKSFNARKGSALLAVCLMLIISRQQATASADTPAVSPQAGEIVLSRTVTPVDDQTGSREFEVELSLCGVPLQTETAADIVLVIDLSQSMTSPLDGSTGSRLLEIKGAANDFILNVLPDGSANRLALVTYSGSPDDGADNDAWINYSFDDWTGRSAFINKMNLLTAVTTLAADDGTNMEAGFIRADDLLTQSASDNKIVIFMTDGEPTFYYDESGQTAGNGTTFDQTAVSRALAAAHSLRQNHDATIFTVGLTAGDSLPENIAAVLNPAQDGYQTAYFQASDKAGLHAVYTHLAQSIDLIARDAVFQDQLLPGFDYIEGSLSVEGLPAGAPAAEISQNVISWQPGGISDEGLKIKYRIIGSNQLYGALPTSQRSWLEFLPADGNDFYNSSYYDNPENPDSRLLEIEPRIVILAPLACDDTFYQVEAGATLFAGSSPDAPSLLDNDHASSFLESFGGWQTTAVKAKLVGDGDLVHGKIDSFGCDGSFTYVSTGTAGGSETFSYDLITEVRDDDGNIRQLSARADVTIEIIPAAAVTEPETAEPETAEPETAEPETAEPETAEPEPEATEIIVDEAQFVRTGEHEAPTQGSGLFMTVLLLLLSLVLVKSGTLRRSK
jgi:Mg-chelatase subunit ChlD